MSALHAVQMRLRRNLIMYYLATSRNLPNVRCFCKIITHSCLLETQRERLSAEWRNAFALASTTVPSVKRQLCFCNEKKRKYVPAPANTGSLASLVRDTCLSNTSTVFVYSRIMHLQAIATTKPHESCSQTDLQGSTAEGGHTILCGACTRIMGNVFLRSPCQGHPLHHKLSRVRCCSKRKPSRV